MEVDPAYQGEPASRLAALASRQHGVIARWQLEGLGFRPGAVDRRIGRAELHPIHRGVYAVGHTNLAYRGRWMAAVLACGPQAVLSHHAAAALHDLRPVPHTWTDVTAPGARTHPGVRCHISADPPRTVIDGIPVTTLARTCLDYAEQATARQLTAALEAAQRQNVLDVRGLHAVMAASPGRHGLKPLQVAIAELTDDPPWLLSDLERDFRELIRAASLPQPRHNVLIEGELVDCAWPEQRLIVEIDGYGYHRSRRSFEDDRRRDTKLQKAGWRVIRVTGDRIRHDAAQLLADLQTLLND